MGHLVNPLLYRLNYSAFWNGSLISASRFDSYINVFSVYFSNFVRGYFKNYNWVDKNFLFVINLKFFFLNKSIFVYVDFWQNATFKQKNIAKNETIFYFFLVALKNRLLKNKKFFKRKTLYNYYLWQMSYIFQKKNIFLKKKLGYKSFLANSLSNKKKFFSRNWKTIRTWSDKDDEFFDVASLVRSRSGEKHNFYSSNDSKFVHEVHSPQLWLNPLFNYYKVNYDKNFINLYLIYCKNFLSEPSVWNVKLFYEFSISNEVPKEVDENFWNKFLEYKFYSKGGAIFDFFNFFVCFFVCFLITKNIEETAAEIEKKKKKELELQLAIKEAKMKEAAKKYSLQIRKLPRKSIKSKLNYLFFAQASLLKKKKLTTYRSQAIEDRLKFYTFSKKGNKFFTKGAISPFFAFKNVYFLNKRKNKVFIKKTWWKSLVYSNFGKKKRVFGQKYKVKKLFWSIKNKRSFYNNLKFKIIDKNVKKHIFYNVNFKLVKKTYFIKSKKKKSRQIKKKKYIFYGLRNFFKKKSFFSKIKFKYNIKNYKYHAIKILKKKIFFIKKRKWIIFKKSPFFRKLYFFNKILFFSKKFPPIFYKITLNNLRNKKKINTGFIVKYNKPYSLYENYIKNKNFNKRNNLNIKNKKKSQYGKKSKYNKQFKNNTHANKKHNIIDNNQSIFDNLDEIVDKAEGRDMDDLDKKYGLTKIYNFGDNSYVDEYYYNLHNKKKISNSGEQAELREWAYEKFIKKQDETTMSDSELKAYDISQAKFLDLYYFLLNKGDDLYVKDFIYYAYGLISRKDFTGKIKPFFLRRCNNENKAESKNKFLEINSNKFLLMLNSFHFFSKMYKLKKNFILQASVITNFFNRIKVFFLIRGQFNFKVNAELVAEFLVLWFMKKKFTIKEILGTLLNFLNKSFQSKVIGGYSILMRGRFSRKDRAMYSWKKLGSMPLSHRISTIEYCNRWVPLKYSQCAFKVYILKSDSYYVRKKHRNVRLKNELKQIIDDSAFE